MENSKDACEKYFEKQSFTKEEIINLYLGKRHYKTDAPKAKVMHVEAHEDMDKGV